VLFLAERVLEDCDLTPTVSDLIRAPVSIFRLEKNIDSHHYIKFLAMIGAQTHRYLDFLIFHITDDSFR